MMGQATLCICGPNSRGSAYGPRLLNSIFILALLTYLMFTGVGSVEPLTAEQEQRKVLEEMNRLLESISDDMKVLGPKGFCINQCLFESITEKCDPTASTPRVPDHIPDDKKTMFGKMARSVIKCVTSCGSAQPYSTFLINLLTMIVNPDMVPEISPNSTISENNTVHGFAIFISYIPENGILLCLKVGFPSVKRIDQKCVSDICINSVDLDVQRTEVETYDDGSLNSNRSNRCDECDEHVLQNTAYASLDLNPSSPRSKKKRSVAFPDDLKDEDEKSNAIESTIYGPAETSIVWPTTSSSYISTSDCPEESFLRQSHPEMLTTRVCVELGVMKNPTMAGDDSASGKNGSTVVICSVDVEPCPGHIVELNEVKFTANAIGSLYSSENGSGVATHKLNELPSLETTEPSSSGSADDARTDVLDRISQDLDYLLNRSPSPSRSRKNVNAKLVNHSPTVLVGNNQNRGL